MDQLKAYLIIMEVIPNQEQSNPQLKGISGATAEIWVFETSLSEAKKKAIRYVQTYGWILKKFVDVVQPPPEQIALLDTEAAKNYRSAEQLGLNAHFLAWPKKKQPGHYSVTSLKKSPQN